MNEVFMSIYVNLLKVKIHLPKNPNSSLVIYTILSGWWYTYPSEKSARQSGLWHSRSIPKHQPGLPIIFPVYSNYIPIIFQLYSNDIPIIFQWYSNYIPIIFPLYSHDLCIHTMIQVFSSLHGRTGARIPPMEKKNHWDSLGGIRNI